MHRAGEGTYAYMFNNCTNLQNAPELSLLTLADYCYEGMFNGCRNLNYVVMLATDISAEGCLDNWLDGVYDLRGTFVKNAAATWDDSDANLPVGWTVEYEEY